MSRDYECSVRIHTFVDTILNLRRLKFVKKGSNSNTFVYGHYGTKRSIAKQTSDKHKRPAFTKPPGVVSQEYEAVSPKTEKSKGMEERYL